LAVLAAAGAIVDYATGNGLSDGSSYGGNEGDLADSFS
jgi:hypothetical protein